MCREAFVVGREQGFSEGGRLGRDLLFSFFGDCFSRVVHDVELLKARGSLLEGSVGNFLLLAQFVGVLGQGCKNSRRSGTVQFERVESCDDFRHGGAIGAHSLSHSDQRLVHILDHQLLEVFDVHLCGGGEGVRAAEHAGDDLRHGCSCHLHRLPEVVESGAQTGDVGQGHFRRIADTTHAAHELDDVGFVGCR